MDLKLLMDMDLAISYIDKIIIDQSSKVNNKSNFFERN